MLSSNYQPEPINTDGIVLPPELAGLTERLAENAHDLWAQQQIKEGWTWGPKRDDAAKKHPCLVTYSQLPESEKDYDLQAAMRTLKSILAIGFVFRVA